MGTLIRSFHMILMIPWPVARCQNPAQTLSGNHAFDLISGLFHASIVSTLRDNFTHDYQIEGNISIEGYFLDIIVI